MWEEKVYIYNTPRIPNNFPIQPHIKQSNTHTLIHRHLIRTQNGSRKKLSFDFCHPMRINSNNLAFEDFPYHLIVYVRHHTYSQAV